MTQLKSFSTSRSEIQNFVHLLKTTLHVQNEPCFPLLFVLEIVLPKLIEGFNYEIVSKQELPDRYAETTPSLNLIKIREDVYDGACSDNPRDRFTIAHEIGHLFLHNSDAITLHRVEHNKKLPAYQDPEWQANTFAGYLLMSPNCIRGLSVDEICAQCKVSKRAAEIQMKFL